VDCGSVYSILPQSSSDPPSGPALVTANKRQVTCWGKRTCRLQFGGRTFKWSFLLAKVSFPIIGANFLREFDLMVDLRRMALVQGAHGWELGLVGPPQDSTFAALGIAPAPAPRVDSSGGQRGSTSSSAGAMPPAAKALPPPAAGSRCAAASKPHGAADGDSFF